MPATNSFVNPSAVAKESLMHLRNNLVMGSKVYKGYRPEFEGTKVGDTLTIKKPQRFQAIAGAQRSNQVISRESTSIVISKRYHVSWAFSSLEKTLNDDQYSKDYIEPAAIVLANQIDADLCGLYKSVFWNAGTAGTTPTTFASMGNTAKVLDTHAVPPDDRYLVLNPAANWGIADGLKGLFFQSKVEGFIEKGKLGSIANFDIFMDQNIKAHASTSWGSAPLVNGASQSGSTLALDAVTSAVTVVEGDIFTIDSVYSVNPISKESTGVVQPFVVTANTTAVSTAIAALPIYPPLRDSSFGATQTVSALPANDAAITVVGSHAANLAFHKNAFALVMVDLEMPDGCPWKARESFDGVSIRVLKDFDIDTDTDIIRMDILYGVKAIYPELAARLLG